MGARLTHNVPLIVGYGAVFFRGCEGDLICPGIYQIF